jgi:hypothetical protein
MSKRRLDVGDVGSSVSKSSRPTSDLKPGLKMNPYNGMERFGLCIGGAKDPYVDMFFDRNAVHPALL